MDDIYQLCLEQYQEEKPFSAMFTLEETSGFASKALLACIQNEDKAMIEWLAVIFKLRCNRIYSETLLACSADNAIFLLNYLKEIDFLTPIYDAVGNTNTGLEKVKHIQSLYEDCGIHISGSDLMEEFLVPCQPEKICWCLDNYEIPVDLLNRVFISFVENNHLTHAQCLYDTYPQVDIYYNDAWALVTSFLSGNEEMMRWLESLDDMIIVNNHKYLLEGAYKHCVDLKVLDRVLAIEDVNYSREDLQEIYDMIFSREEIGFLMRAWTDGNNSSTIVLVRMMCVRIVKWIHAMDNTFLNVNDVLHKGLVTFNEELIEWAASLGEEIDFSYKNNVITTWLEMHPEQKKLLQTEC